MVAFVSRVIATMRSMRRLADIDLLDDHALRQEMTWASMGILVGGTLAGVLAAVILPHERIDPLWFLALALGSVGALPVHELVHAAAFKLLTGFRAHVRFGFGGWMLYTSAEGTIMRRHRFCAVLLAPTVLVSVALFVVAGALGSPLLGWFLVVIHLAGCTGDLAYVRIVMREPMATHVEDTAYGIALFHDA